MSCCPSDDDVRAAVTNSFLEERCAAADTGDKLSSSRRRSMKTGRRASVSRDRNLAIAVDYHGDRSIRCCRATPTPPFSSVMASAGRRLVLLLAVLVLVGLVAGAGLVGAARPAPAERCGDGGAYLLAYPAAERARETVEMLTARLPAGPSRRGAGH
ncbi:hypothetical protein ZWY2020_036327 [Hordeum vulgare]|nr:hypothetical protein ZWY2020_036327 [Hordeum vulgare]